MLYPLSYQDERIWTYRPCPVKPVAPACNREYIPAMLPPKLFTTALVVCLSAGQRRAVESLRLPGESRADVMRRALALLVAESEKQRGKK